MPKGYEQLVRRTVPSPHEAMAIDSGEIEIQEDEAEGFRLRDDATEQTPEPSFVGRARRPAPTAFDEEAKTRIAQRIDSDSDLIELSSVMEVYEVGDSRKVNSGATMVRRPAPAPATPAFAPAKPAPAPARAEIPVISRTERGDEKSVIRRFVESVVTAVPRAFKAAVDRTGAHRLGARPQKQADGEDTRPRETQPAPRQRQPRQIDQRDWRDMRTAPIFDGLPNEALRDALLSGDAQVLKLGRDSLVPLAGAVALLRSGQVALALFAEEVLKTERKAAEEVDRARGTDKLEKAQKKERKRRTAVGPLIELADKNLATFEEGDVVELMDGFDTHAKLAAYAVTPTQVITIARARVDLWKRIYPFMSDRFRRANQQARARLDATDGAKALVADFFIRHGLSVSMTLRVRKIDACIECRACEIACEERYGAKRLSLHGRILGGLDFVDACHTCTDARCIDPCNFDAISFDAQRKEILIKEDNCTGCTLCASACPYDAIEMHELDDKPLLKLRLEKEKKLGFGEGAGRKARLRRIASKCDHCAFYADQACVSACPTGALVEVSPQDVVAALPEQARATARAGFDRTTPINVRQLNEPSSFMRGLQIPELGRARAPRTKLLIGMWWTLGLLAVVLAGLEIFLRKVFPGYSVGYWMAVHVDGIEPELALNSMDFRPGCELAVNYGYAGTFIMISGLAYVWRRRLGFMRNWGSLRAWFDWHVMTGVVGPIFTLYHTAAKLDNWVSLAFWSMVLTVISGLLGRYLTTELPDKASTALMETLELDRQLATLRASHPGVRAADGWFDSYRRKIGNWERRLNGGKKDRDVKKKHSFWGAVLSLFWVALDDVTYGHRLRVLRRALRKNVKGPGTRPVRREAERLARRLALLERRRVLMPLLEPVFMQWRAVHVPMAVSLTVIAGIHIYLSLRS